MRKKQPVSITPPRIQLTGPDLPWANGLRTQDEAPIMILQTQNKNKIRRYASCFGTRKKCYSR